MSDRLLLLERFLAENTDEETFVSTGDIVATYEQNGFGNNRNNVKADLMLSGGLYRAGRDAAPAER